jgi:hypothetical protein
MIGQAAARGEIGPVGIILWEVCRMAYGKLRAADRT